MAISLQRLADLGLLRVVLEFCSDNGRIFISHTCLSLRGRITPFIPSKTCFKTLTPPKILPDLFDHKNGVYYITLPTTGLDVHFAMNMLGHVDLGHHGVRALRWLMTITKHKPALDTRKVFVARHMMIDDKVGLSHRQMQVVEQRLRDGRDAAMLVHDRQHWDIIKDMLFSNESIKRFIFYTSPNDNGESCYREVFEFLDNRACKTDYLDLSGPLTQATRNTFDLLASNLTGIMLRRMPNQHMLSLLSSIFMRPDAAKLECLQFESVSVGTNVLHIVLDILEVLVIKRFLLQSISFQSSGFSSIFAVISSACSVEKFFLRKCQLSLCEVVQCLFLPIVPESSITELYLSGTSIPEEAAQALGSCVESSKFLTTLALDGCDLGVKCVTAVVDGLERSSITDLDLGGAIIKGLAHKLFHFVALHRRIRYLSLDDCLLCKRSVKEYSEARKEYAKGDIPLKVSLERCRFVPKGEKCVIVF